MTRHQNTHILEAEKVNDVIMTSFLNQNMRTFHKIVFAHTKFALVQMKGSGVKTGGGILPLVRASF